MHDFCVDVYGFCIDAQLLRQWYGINGCGGCPGPLVPKQCRVSDQGLNSVATDCSEPYVLNKHIALGTSAVVDIFSSLLV